MSTGEELNVTRNPGNYIGHHRLESQEMLHELGMIKSYMHCESDDALFVREESISNEKKGD